MDKHIDDLYKKTDGVLFNYQTIKAEIRNLDLEIEELQSECIGVSGVSYKEKTGATNAFNSSVENEVLKKEKLINKLLREKGSKERLISKIDNALSTLEDEERAIVELRCFKKMGWNKVGAIIDKDGDYCCRLKRKVVKNLADLVWIGKKYIE